MNIIRIPAAKSRRRLWVGMACIAVATLAVFALAVKLEMSYRAAIRAEAMRSSESDAMLPAPRGCILDRNGAVLAGNRTMRVAAVHYRWLQIPPDEDWLLARACERLPKEDRENAKRLEAAKAAVRGERFELARRLMQLCGMPPEQWIARTNRIRTCVKSIAENVNQRRQMEAAAARFADKSWSGWIRRLLGGDPPPPRITAAEEADYYAMTGDLPDAIAAEIENHPDRFPGVKIVSRSGRWYPGGTAAAHVLGTLGLVGTAELSEHQSGEPVYGFDDWVGRMGIERLCETSLRGRHGTADRRTDFNGQVLDSRTRRESMPGRDVRLCLDFELQRTADKLLQNIIKSRKKETLAPWESPAGAVVVMDVRDGAIRVSSSAPTYDPSVFVAGSPGEVIALDADPTRPMLDRTYRAAFPPGATFQTLAAAALLESKTVDEQERFNCPGYWIHPALQQCPIYAREGVGHGPVTLADALAFNCNVFFFESTARMKSKPLIDWAERFGFGRPTGTDRPGESAGTLPTPENIRLLEHHAWKTLDTQALAVGQGSLAASPLQIVRMIAAVANGGRLLAPHVMEEEVRGQGSEVRTGKGISGGLSQFSSDENWTVPFRSATVIDSPVLREQGSSDNSLKQADSGSVSPSSDLGLSPRTLQVIREGLRRAVADPKGAAHAAVFLEAIPIAGIASTNETGEDRTCHAWFAGYAPADDPKLAFIVMLQNAGDADESACPAAKQLVLRMKELGML